MIAPFRHRLRPRRGDFQRVAAESAKDAAFWDDLDLCHRTLCSVMFNYVPSSGHPGGSVSSARLAAGLLFETLDYDLADPARDDADRVVYAAGHKALGLYAFWALRDELARSGAPDLLPEDPALRLRLEDLLGFRRNPTQPTPLFASLRAKALDGHPTPAVPFVPFATGASGVGLGAAVGYALGLRDRYGESAPAVHVIEGEGGLTPGRAAEALAAAATLGLERLYLHVDWNQSSIDSDRVCPLGEKPGDYVQWNPLELLRLHDWNVYFVSQGHNAGPVLAAQRRALGARAGVPTAVVYRTVKGNGYGIEGRKSHGSGHAPCSPAFYETLSEFEARFGLRFPRPRPGLDPAGLERAYWDTLLVVRQALVEDKALAGAAARRLRLAAERLGKRRVRPRAGAPRLELLYAGGVSPEKPPAGVVPEPGKPASTRAALGDALGWLNRWTKGAFLGAAADLLESTSVSGLNAGFPGGFHHVRLNPESRLVPLAGICEDVMGCAMSGLSSLGAHVGVTSSYAAFIAALEHVPARLHAIGQQAKGGPRRTWIMVNAHAGPMTGEDGPTHADPQALQLLQGNFPGGSLITLTPWDPQEVWPLLTAGLLARPAVLAPFVTRPAVPVFDRRAVGLPSPYAAARGLYAFRRAAGPATVVLQGAAVTTLFVRDVLPRLDKEKLAVNVFYAASAELFDLLPEAERRALWPEELARAAMGITDFTMPTMERWVCSTAGRRATLHPFKRHGFLGSGSWEAVLAEGGLGGDAQFEAVRAWAEAAG